MKRANVKYCLLVAKMIVATRNKAICCNAWSRSRASLSSDKRKITLGVGTRQIAINNASIAFARAVESNPEPTLDSTFSISRGWHCFCHYDDLTEWQVSTLNTLTPQHPTSWKAREKNAKRSLSTIHGWSTQSSTLCGTGTWVLDGKVRAKEALQVYEAMEVKSEKESWWWEVSGRMQMTQTSPTMKLTRWERSEVRRQTKSTACQTIVDYSMWCRVVDPRDNKCRCGFVEAICHHLSRQCSGIFLAMSSCACILFVLGIYTTHEEIVTCIIGECFRHILSGRCFKATTRSFSSSLS